MKKRTVSVLLAAAMTAGSLAGCGSSGSSSSNGQGNENASAEEGKVINIYSWNNQL